MSILHRHAQVYHGGREFEVKVSIMKQCFGDASKRQITEAVLIDELTENETMNTKVSGITSTSGRLMSRNMCYSYYTQCPT